MDARLAVAAAVFSLALAPASAVAQSTGNGGQQCVDDIWNDTEPITVVLSEGETTIKNGRIDSDTFTSILGSLNETGGVPDPGMLFSNPLEAAVEHETNC